MSVYFAQRKDNPDGPIKIGYTKDMGKRIYGLESALGGTVSILGLMPGSMKVERAMHRRFAAHRIGLTEQFRPAPELLEFIRDRPMERPVFNTGVGGGRPRRGVPIIAAKIEKRSWDAAAFAAEDEGVTTSEWISRIVYEAALPFLRREAERLRNFDYEALRAELEAEKAAKIAELDEVLQMCVMAREEAD